MSLEEKVSAAVSHIADDGLAVGDVVSWNESDFSMIAKFVYQPLLKGSCAFCALRVK